MNAMDVVRAIATYMDSHGVPPTYRELATVLGVSVTTAYAWTRRSEAMGLVRLVSGRGRAARNIRLTDHAQALLPTPLDAAGNVPARILWELVRRWERLAEDHRVAENGHTPEHRRLSSVYALHARDLRAAITEATR